MISQKHNFVFIHPPKCAGNTLHRIFEPCYDTGIKVKVTPNRSGPVDGVSLMRITAREKGQRAFPIHEERIVNKHWTYDEVLSSFPIGMLGTADTAEGVEIIENLRLISAIRNPWARIASWFCFWEKIEYSKLREMKDAADKLKKWYSTHPGYSFPASHYYSNRHPDFIVRQEHFMEDVTQLLYYLDVPIPSDLAGMNFNRGKWRPTEESKKYNVIYRDIYRKNGSYDEELIETIRKDHKKDIEFSERLFAKPYDF